MLQILLPSRVREVSKDKTGSFANGAIVYLVACVVSFLILAISSLIGETSIVAQLQKLFDIMGLEAVGLGGILGYSAYGFVSGIFSGLVLAGVASASAARLFGGKGKAEQLFYTMMIIFGGLLIYSSIFQFLSIIFTFIGLLFPMVLGIYGLYLLYLAIKFVCKTERAGTIGALILGYLALIILYVVLFFAIFWAFGISFSGATAPLAPVS